MIYMKRLETQPFLFARINNISYYVINNRRYTKMAKDKFYHSGMINSFDGNCDTCPFWMVKDNRMICKETMKDVSYFTIHGKINHNCPFVTK